MDRSRFHLDGNDASFIDGYGGLGVLNPWNGRSAESLEGYGPGGGLVNSLGSGTGGTYNYNQDGKFLVPGSSGSSGQSFQSCCWWRGVGNVDGNFTLASGANSASEMEDMVRKQLSTLSLIAPKGIICSYYRMLLIPLLLKHPMRLVNGMTRAVRKIMPHNPLPQISQPLLSGNGKPVITFDAPMITLLQQVSILASPTFFLLPKQITITQEETIF